MSAARQVASETGVPLVLLEGLLLVESRRGDQPWPWTLNDEGRPLYFNNREAALRALADALLAGRTPDVGCAQVSVRYHAQRFAGVADALDPVANVRAAADYLMELRDQYGGDWVSAAGAYHSRTPHLHFAYRCRLARTLAPDLSFPQCAGVR